MAYATLDGNGNITGLFGCPQSHRSDFSEIDDNDPRIAAFEAAMQLVPNAQAALSKSDITIARITEAVIGGHVSFSDPDVVAWATYRAALRGIISSGAGTLPEQPAYPAGT